MTTRVVIDLDAPGTTISRHLYGHFAEHLGRCIYGGFWVGKDSSIPHRNGIRTDVVEALRRIRIPNLRWPGGCFADEYHWRDGIGDPAERPRMINSHWGDIVESNAFGTHEFFELCEMLGADPYVSGNVGSGTVREMSEWVEYITRGDDSPMANLRRQNGRDEPWHVPFWGVGNEPWGCGGTMRAEPYADLARQFATYLRNHSGNTLYRVAAGADSHDYKWTEALMQAISGHYNKPFVEAISLHQYTVPGSWNARRGTATVFDEDGYYATIKKAQDIETLIRRHSTIMDVYDPDKKVGLVLDEWGTWWDVEPGTNPGFLFQQNTMRDALVASVHFDAFHRSADRLTMANIAQTVNVLQSVILIDPKTDELILTPTFHVFEMNTGHHDAQLLPLRLDASDHTKSVDGSDIPTVSASASTTGDTALVSLSNLDAAGELTVVLDLRGRSVVSAKARLLAADSLQDHNTATRPDAVSVRDHEVRAADGTYGHGLAVTLPAASYATIELELA